MLLHFIVTTTFQARFDSLCSVSETFYLRAEKPRLKSVLPLHAYTFPIILLYYLLYLISTSEILIAILGRNKCGKGL